MRKAGLTIANIALWLTFGGTGAYFFGPDGFLLIVLIGLLAMAVTLRSLDITKRRRFRKVLAVIADKNEQSIRFDGTPAQLSAAIDIGQSNGWIGEPLPQADTQFPSIRFTPSEGAVSAHIFLDALIEADLVRKIAP